MFLHSGWGHEAMPFDPQIPALAGRYRILIPHRSGYGLSARVPALDLHFHQQAADETLALLDALEMPRAVLWGHSDGAVIAAICALRHPDRCRALVLEALHLDFAKPSSREFFETGVRNPDEFGPRAAAVLEREHGSDWRDVIRRFSGVWLEIARHSRQPEEFFYGARLSGIRTPALLLYGENDPRMEPNEIEMGRRALPAARCAVVPAGGHAPHAEAAAAPEVARIVGEFLASLR